MDIRMIVTDLDRTLLRTDKTISGYSAQVLNRCRELGYRVVFATARPERTVRAFCAAVLADALILHNGALVMAGEETLWHFGVSPTDTQTVLHLILAECPGATLSTEIGNVLYANFDVSIHWNNTQAVQTDFSDLPQRPADKIIAGTVAREDMKRLAPRLPLGLYAEWNDGKLMLVMRREATKLNAIRLLAKRYGYGIEKAVAFGDDLNDLEMIRDCGAGVAMDNALAEVKAVAGHICASNDEDGAARWIAEHLL